MKDQTIIKQCQELMDIVSRGEKYNSKQFTKLINTYPTIFTEIVRNRLTRENLNMLRLLLKKRSQIREGSKDLRTASQEVSDFLCSEFNVSFE